MHSHQQAAASTVIFFKPLVVLVQEQLSALRVSLKVSIARSLITLIIKKTLLQFFLQILNEKKMIPPGHFLSIVAPDYPNGGVKKWVTQIISST